MQQTRKVLLSPESRDGADGRLAGWRAFASGETVEIDAVRNVVHAARIQVPDVGCDPSQVAGGQYHRAARQHQPARQYASADLRVAFFRAEAVLDVDVANQARDVGHRPLDRAPIVGNQQVRRELAQQAAEASRVAERRTLRRLDWLASQIECGRQESRAGIVAVHRHHDVPIAVAEGIGQRDEAHLRATDGERCERVQQQRW